ncbi:DUF4178 domain-containing protein [Methylogaea oryzae]|uniref:DUF4178 domain-containing protein n=1 Tax=Methylogaea oryzae TaxID=1295382 RepID=A0A8D5AI93_9GAMM|nr:DUF4178 domain-containing protein [Methylogaea oryzae]BBL71111.1 hypothetical protein MoryE10_17170 [Methylogaea oryzae]
MKTANCPSCGAPVEFRCSVSILAVCGYCRSTLVRHGTDLENLGKMAELLDDQSLIQLGTEGSYRGVRFAVVGRIQLRYSAGLWNEWHLLFDNQRSGWLGEANGQYFVTFLSATKDALPAYADLYVGQQIRLQGRDYHVANLDSSRCIGGAGELPFMVGEGYDTQVADLRSDTRFATLDYSETPPLLFLGEGVEFDSLKLANLRAEPQKAALAAGQVKSFQCPQCAAPLQIHSDQIETVACGSCESILDAADPNYSVISRFRAAAKIKPTVALGSRGRFEGADFDVIGYLRRRDTQWGAEWGEYLLLNPEKGFRWLVESKGHWSYVRTLNRQPMEKLAWGKPVAQLLGKNYKHFENSAAEVSYVVGEFYWRVKVGETVRITDYVNPPQVLSEERTDQEAVWSLGEYLAPETVQQAFASKQALPKPIGVALNQPWPHAEASRRTWLWFGLFAVLLTLIQVGSMVLSSGKTVYETTLPLPLGAGQEDFESEPFQVSGRPSNVEIRSSANVDNSWVYLNLQLVEADTGAVRTLGREISYYHGVDGGESWSEGGTDDEAVVFDVPAGRYYLVVDPELPSDFRGANVRLRVVRDVPSAANYWIALLLLSLWPLGYWWRKNRFEIERWKDSDHPLASEGD